MKKGRGNRDGEENVGKRGHNNLSCSDWAVWGTRSGDPARFPHPSTRHDMRSRGPLVRGACLDPLIQPRTDFPQAPAMPPRFLFGPTTAEFADSRLGGLRRAGECLAFGPCGVDLTVGFDTRCDEIAGQLPEGWRP